MFSNQPPANCPARCPRRLRDRWRHGCRHRAPWTGLRRVPQAVGRRALDTASLPQGPCPPTKAGGFASEHFRSRLAVATLSMTGAPEHPARNAGATAPADMLRQAVPGRCVAAHASRD
ncbi:hypothetical protein XAP412_510055 [Xanthomonas phaseoli pv. phaseoli]|uniref:Uncharacterized protein n=1 Tax=Xanthomonas campestris pv. phaseoli TaxID=317013 RepID=A0ABY1TUP9_XANCH|nr:hypothetical protein XAP6984_560054 [Xanthomonas phaseoli pv. phaseoli]SON86997.1 hypothetical protein XAP412_510055 [Xanthomonas phaseoli pv. phaseoli]